MGLKGILTNIAKCCNPAPGDDIIGYITRGRGATVHRRDCPNVLRMKDHERIVKVSWGEPKRTFPVMIQVKAYDRQGLMGDISTVLANEGINMRDIKVKIANNLATINLMLDISDISQLSRLLTLTESLPNVMEAFRVNPVKSNKLDIQVSALRQIAVVNCQHHKALVFIFVQAILPLPLSFIPKLKEIRLEDVNFLIFFHQTRI